MRPIVLLLLALAIPTPAHATPGERALVVQLSAEALGASDASHRALTPGTLPASVRARFSALGVRAVRSFAMNRALSRPLGTGRPLPEPYGFAPERIVLLEAPDSALASSALRALVADPQVDWAERVVTRTPTVWSLGPSPDAEPAPLAARALDSLPNDPSLRAGRQYALLNLGPAVPGGGLARADVRAVEGWRRSVGSESVKLAVADTGIDPDHPELGGSLAQGGPRITDAFNATDDPDPSVTDRYGHGTPVAGVMAARTNDGSHFAPTTGIAGVCGGDGRDESGCRLVPIKIAPGFSGSASSFDIARALLHAADVGARAVNLSFASTTPSRLERLALTYALYNGCIAVCAAGNNGFDTPTAPLYPAAHAREGIAISVGASDARDRRTLFSSYPESLDLLAPGENVLTTFMTYPSHYGASYPGYVPASGTSFAAPHVTGAIGLLAAVRPELSDRDFQHLLRATAYDIGEPGFDAPTAHGRLDLERLLDRVGPGTGVWHDEVAADSFGTAGEGTLVVHEGGPGTLARYVGTHSATRIVAQATVAIPDSFLRVTDVWLRVAGTMAARGDFRIPWFAPYAEVAERDERTVTFRGWLYRVGDDSCTVCDDRYVPLAPSNVRFAFGVLGTVDRAPTVSITEPAGGASAHPGESLLVSWVASDPDTLSRVAVAFVPDAGGELPLGSTAGDARGGAFTLPCAGPVDVPGRLVVTAHDDRGRADQGRAEVPFVLRGGTCSAPLATFRASPSPFRDALRVFAPGTGRVQVLDAAGRRVRDLPTSGGEVLWDGYDARGARVGPGVYFVRYTGAAGTTARRVVRLDR